jgi:putative nucleotidyltransferase-like protein/coenzyme PQQ synthesis protein D (PqqD)
MMALPADPLHGAAPIGEDQLILAVAGTAGRRAATRAAAVELGARIDPDRLVTRLVELGLTGVLGPRLTPLVRPAARDDFAGRVGAWLDAHRHRAELQSGVLRSVRRKLAAAGIAAVALKGPDLARRVHGDAGARRSADLDVLVPADQMGPAVGVLARLGYAVLAHDAAPWRRELHQAVHHPSPELPPVELHWRVEWYSGRPFAADLLDRAVNDADGILRLQPVDELAALLLIAARDGLLGMRLLADIAAWWDRYGEIVPPAGLRDLAIAHPRLARPLATAAAAAHRLVGLPADSLLSLAPARTRRSRLALRLADPLLDAYGPCAAGAALVDGLLCDRRALRGWMRRRLFRPRGHVALTYGLAPDARLLTSLVTALMPLRSGISFATVLLGRGPGPLAAEVPFSSQAPLAVADAAAGFAASPRRAVSSDPERRRELLGRGPTGGSRDLPGHVAVHSDVVWQVVDGSVVLLSLAGGRYYRLDRVASRMWVVLDELPETTQALERLRGEYEVDEATLRRDLTCFIHELVDDGLLYAAP